MKRLILAVSAMILLSLAGWGQNSPREQDSHAKVARHHHENSNQANRHNQRRRHRHHHHRQTGT